jgi:hypothetical protein
MRLVLHHFPSLSPVRHGRRSYTIEALDVFVGLVEGVYISTFWDMLRSLIYMTRQLMIQAVGPLIIMMTRIPYQNSVPHLLHSPHARPLSDVCLSLFSASSFRYRHVFPCGLLDQHGAATWCPWSLVLLLFEAERLGPTFSSRRMDLCSPGVFQRQHTLWHADQSNRSFVSEFAVEQHDVRTRSISV